MANYFQTQPLALPEYVPKYDVDSYVKVGMAMQQQYEQGVDKVQQTIDQMSTLPVGNEVSRRYLQDKINNVTNTLNSQAGSIDFRNKGEVKSLTALASSVANDPYVYRAVESGLNMQRDQLANQEDQKSKSYNPNNAAYMQEQMNKYRNATSLDATYTTSYNKSYDYLTPLNNMLKNINPNMRVQITPGGIGVLGFETLKEVSPSRVKDVINEYFNSDANAAKQLRIDSWAKYRGANDQDLDTEIQRRADLVTIQIQEGIDFLDRSLNSIRDPENDKYKQYAAEKKHLEEKLAKYNAQKSDILGNLPNFEDKAYFLQRDNISNLMGDVYSYSSEEMKQEKDFQAQFLQDEWKNNMDVQNAMDRNTIAAVRAQNEALRTQNSGARGTNSQKTASGGEMSWSSPTMGANSTITPEEQYNDFVESNKNLKNEKIANQVNLTAMWLKEMYDGKTGGNNFDKAFLGDINSGHQVFTYNNSKGTYEPGKDFNKYSAQIANAVTQLNTIVSEGKIVLPQPIREQFDKTNMLTMLSNANEQVEKNLVNSPQVASAKQDYLQKKNTIVNIIKFNPNIATAVAKAGLNEDNVANIAAIDEIVGGIGYVANRVKQVGTSLGAAWNNILHTMSGGALGSAPRTQADTKAIIDQVVADLKEETGVKDEKALEFYVRTAVLPSIGSGRSGTVWDVLNGPGPFKTNIERVGIGDSYKNLQNARGQAYINLGLLSQSQYSTLMFSKESDKTMQMEQIKAQLSASLSSVQRDLERSSNYKEISKMLEVADPKDMTMTYNNYDTQNGNGVFFFTYKDPSDKDTPYKHVEAKLPLSIFEGLPNYPQTRYPGEPQLIYALQSLKNGRTGNSGPTGIPLKFDSDGKGNPVRATYHVNVINGKMNPIIYLYRNGKWEGKAVPNNTGEPYYTDDTAAMLEALHSYSIPELINMFDNPQ